MTEQEQKKLKELIQINNKLDNLNVENIRLSQRIIDLQERIKNDSREIASNLLSALIALNVSLAAVIVYIILNNI